MRKYSLITSNRVIDGNTRYLNLQPIINPQGLLALDEFGNLGLSPISTDGVTQEQLLAKVPDGGTVGQVLKKDASGNNTWQADANTTYSVITSAEFQEGTSPNNRNVSAASLNRDILWKVNQPNVLNGNTLRTDTGTGFRIPRFDATNGFWTTSATAIVAATPGSIAIRDSNGRFQLTAATNGNEPAILDQLQNVGSIKANALRTDSFTGTRTPVFNGATGEFTISLPTAAASAQINSFAVRDSNGRIKAVDGIAVDDVITLNQFSGVINNALSATETSASLNTAYPSAVIGLVVRSITNSVEYTKISATQWKKEPISIA